MAELRLVGAVGIKVRPDTTGFRSETQRDINQALGTQGDKVDAKAKVDVDADVTKAKAKITKLSEEIKNKGVKLNVGIDYDGVQRAKEQINQALKSLDNKVLSFSMNKESIADAKRELKKLEQNAKVEMKIIRDEAGFKSVLKKIQQIRNEKGLTKVVKFATDKESLKKAEKEALEGLARLEAQRTVTIGYTKNYDGLLGAIGEIDKRLEDIRKLKITTKLDDASLEATRSKLLTQLQTAPVTIKFNEDKEGYEKVLSRIKEIRRQKAQVEITFDTDEATLAAKTLEIKEKLRSLTNLGSGNDALFRLGIQESSVVEAEHKAKELKEKIDNMQAAIKIGLHGHLPVAAELAYLGRDRVVNYFARVSGTSITAAEGMLKSLGGIGILSSAGDNIAQLFTKFDTLSLKAAGLAAVLGNLANVGIYAGTALFTIGEGVTASLGLLAAAPAIMTAFGASLFVYTAAFDNFVGAFSSDAKKRAAALAELPPKAREVVESVRGLYNEMQRPVQNAFWESMDGSLQGLIDHTIPTLKEGLLQIAPAMGRLTGGILNSFNKMSLNGDLKTMFGNLEGFFVNLSKASEPFFDGFNKFGLKGSELLPRFGQWIADAASRFDKWSSTASADGRIIEWIEHGANSLKNMWEVGGSVTDMFKAITSAASDAGMGGLAQFNLNMREAADRMMGEPWQSRAREIFEGARLGAEGLNTGFEELTTTMGKSSTWLGTVLTQLGNIGGASLSRLSDLLGRQTYQNGITTELAGLQELVDELSPSFAGLGDVIGNLSTVAGAVMRDLAPVLNGITGLLDSVTTTLADNLAKVAPKMLATIGGVIAGATPLVLGLTDALNGILDLVSNIPNNFVVAGVAAAAFFSLRGLSSKFFESLQQSDKFKALESSWLTQQAVAGKTVDKYKMVNGELQKFTVPTDKFNVLTAGFSTAGGAISNYRDQLARMNDLARTDGMSPLRANMMTTATVMKDGLSKAAGGLLNVLGGPWGLAIGAAAIGIGLFAQKQADAKADTDAMTAALDKQTGVMNKQGLEEIAKRWTDIGKAQDGMANLARGSTKAANETVSALGQSVSDMTLELSKGGDAASGLTGKWQTLGNSMKVLEGAMQSRRPLDQVRGDADKAAAALGLTVEKIQESGIHADDILHVAKNLQEEASKADVARLVFQGLGEATGQTTIEAQQMATAMQVIGDNSTTAASKIGAINKALDLLKGGKQSAREAEVAAASTFQSAVSQAAALKEQLAGNNHLIDETTKLIDQTNPAGLKLQQSMSGAADGIKIAAQAAYQAARDAGKAPVDAMAASKKVLESHKGDLKAIADAAGVDVSVIQAEWDGFFGKDWELNAVFSASADKFQAAKKVVEESGLEWNDKTFEAMLFANPDPAKISVDDAAAWAKNYANSEYKAQLTAINPQALQYILQATGTAEAYKNGDYTAVMKALNSTSPGVQAALQALLAVKDGNYAAAIKAFLDAVSANATGTALDALAAQKRIATISVQYTDPGPAPGTAGRGLKYANENGSLTGSRFLPEIRQFANGGFNGLQFAQRGGAKIYPASPTWTVFAEETTGGEAFIPMAASKRGRSTQILAEVAQQFGYSLTKAQAFENGGIVSGGNSKATSGLQVHIGTFNQNAQDTIEDVGRGIMRQARNAGVAGILDGI
jgi:hypothetical protein